VKRFRRTLSILSALALINGPTAVQACTVCMGDPNSNLARGANAAIFLMLGVLAGIFSLLGAFGVYLYRKAKAPTPPHAELGEAISAPPAAEPI
jgi:hypothetical protein